MNNSFHYSDFFQYCNSLFSCWWIQKPEELTANLANTQDRPLISFVNPHYPPYVSIFEYSQSVPELTGTLLAIVTNTPYLTNDISCQVPLIATTGNSNDVMESLMPYLQKNLRKPLLQHGVMMDIFGKGVFITGPSGIGKSACAMQLLSKRHRLISDDIVCFYRAKCNQVIAYSPPALFNLLEIRELGIIDVQQWYGPCSTLNEKTLDLIISLNQAPNDIPFRTLKKQLDEKIILGVSIPHISLNLAFKQDLAMLIESAVQFAFSSSTALIDKLLAYPFMVSTEPHS